MKKIFATLLLLVFTSNIVSFAGEAIVIDSDGQARYENEDLNTAVVKEAVTNLATEKPDLRGKAEVKVENQEVKINVKDIDENNVDINKYHEKFQKYSKIETDYFYKLEINKKLKGYKYYNYPIQDNFNEKEKDKNRIEISLQDGDYAIINNNIKGMKKYKYAAEYHKDGSLFGIIQIKTIKKTRKSATIAFYEYRQSTSDPSYFYNKHNMFLDIEKKKDKINIAQFIYKYKIDLKYLICCQINNDLYLNEKSKNLIVKMKKFDIPKNSNSITKGIGTATSNYVHWYESNMFHDSGSGYGTNTALEIAAFACYGGPLGIALIWPALLGYFGITELIYIPIGIIDTVVNY